MFFMVRHKEDWSKPVIIKQDLLLDYFENRKIGSKSKGNAIFYFSYEGVNVKCSGQDFTKHIRDFSDFPQIRH